MDDFEPVEELEKGEPPPLGDRERRELLDPPARPPGVPVYSGGLTAPPPPQRPRLDIGTAQTRAAARVIDMLRQDPRMVFTLIEESSRDWSHKEDETFFVARYLCDLGPLGSCSLAHTVGQPSREVRVEHASFRHPLLGQLVDLPAMKVALHDSLARTHVDVASADNDNRIELAATTLNSIDQDCGFGMVTALQLANASFGQVGESASEVVEVTWPERDAVVPPALFVASRLIPLLDEIQT